MPVGRISSLAMSVYTHFLSEQSAYSRYPRMFFIIPHKQFNLIQLITNNGTKIKYMSHFLITAKSVGPMLDIGCYCFSVWALRCILDIYIYMYRSVVEFKCTSLLNLIGKCILILSNYYTAHSANWFGVIWRLDHAFGCRVSIELSIILSPGLHGYIRHGGGLQRSEEPEHLSVGVDMTGLYNKKKHPRNPCSLKFY